MSRGLPYKKVTMYNFPLTLPYPGASTVCGADGATVAECPDADTAAWLCDTLNALLAWWDAEASAADSPADIAADLAATSAVAALILAFDRGVAPRYGGAS